MLKQLYEFVMGGMLSWFTENLGKIPNNSHLSIKRHDCLNVRESSVDINVRESNVDTITCDPSHSDIIEQNSKSNDNLTYLEFEERNDIICEGDIERLSEALDLGFADELEYLHLIMRPLIRGDVAILRAFANHKSVNTYFASLVQGICVHYNMKNNSIVFDLIIGWMSQHTTSDHKQTLQRMLERATNYGFCADKLNKIEEVLRSLSTEYTWIKPVGTYMTDKFMRKILNHGIKSQVASIIPELQSSNLLDIRYCLIKTVQFAIKSKSTNRDILLLVKSTDEMEVTKLRTWYRDLDFISSEIHLQDNSAPPADLEILEHIIPNLMGMMDRFSHITESQEILQAVYDFMLQLSVEVEKLNESYVFIPILVGSAAEETRCYFPDEFDFLIVMHKVETISFDNIDAVLNELFNCIKEVLKCPLPRMIDERLILDNVMFLTENKFPFIQISWIGEVFCDLTLGIDLIPCVSSTESISFSKHNYLRKDWFQQFYKTQMKKSCSVFLRSLSDDPSGNSTVYSLVENEIINTLPDYIRKGYKIAKALRISKLFAPVIPQLIELGVTSAIDTTIKTYYLKTCVFFITKNHDLSASENNDPFNWAIKIYVTLKQFLLQGNIPQYFETELKFECEHKINVSERPRFWCCRQRAAMLLIVDRILHLLCK